MIYLRVFVLVIFFQILSMFKFNGKKIYENLFYFILSSYIFFIAALRDGIGYDFYAYKALYHKISTSQRGIQDLANRLNIELGHIILNEISSNFEFLIFIVAILGVAVKLWFIKKESSEKFLSLLLYFSGVFLTFDMGVMRQGISISFFLISLKYVEERRLPQFIIIIGIGTLFHLSSLIFIPIYFIEGKKFSRLEIYTLTAIAFFTSMFDLSNLTVKVLSLLPFSIISSKISYYSTFDTGDISISLIKRIIVLIIFVEFYERKKIKDLKSLRYLNGYFLSVLLMGFFSSIDIIGGRGSTGLYFLQIFVFSTIFSKSRKIYTKLVIFILVIMLSGYSMKSLIKYGNAVGQKYTPYRSILE